MLQMLDALTDEDPSVGIQRADNMLHQEIYSRTDINERQKERIYKMRRKTIMAKLMMILAETLQDVRNNTPVRCKGCSKPECQYQKI